MRKKVLTLVLLALMLAGCSFKNEEVVSNATGSVYYEIFVGSFSDSNNDGIGDLQGVINRLDYLEELGIKGIWLMPIMPSNTYHKYDVIDYYDIDEDYGTLEDFKLLIEEAKKRNIDVIIDLVLNHTADDHPWFIEAKKAMYADDCENNEYCSYYNISKDSIPNSEKVGVYNYECPFWGEMPDLNLDNETVKNEIKDIMEYWLDLGVKGFRLDAVTSYYSNDTLKNIEFLAWVNETCKDYKEDTYIVGEAWSGQSIVLDYYKSGIDSFFNFELSSGTGDIISKIKSGKGSSLAEMNANYLETLKSTNSLASDSIFLSNHDQNRSGAYLIDEKQERLAIATYLLMNGSPYIYYGEEVSLLGSGIDENKRRAMLWSKDSDENPNNPIGSDYSQKEDYYVDEMLKDDDSLLNLYKDIISTRNKHTAFNNGVVSYIDVNNNSVFAQQMTNDNDEIIVLHNFSDIAQEITLDTNLVIETVFNSDSNIKFNDNTLTIQAYSTIVLSKGE